MKKVLLVALVVGAFFMGTKVGENNVIMNQEIYGSGETFYSNYNGNVNEYHHESNLNVNDIVSVMNTQENILIKDDSGYVKYVGTIENMNNEFKELEVSELAACDDTEFTTTIILK